MTQTPLRLSFLCPDVLLRAEDAPHATYICDLLLEVVHEAFAGQSLVSVTDPAALPATTPDGELATHVHVVDNEGLAERFIVARRHAIAWFEIDFERGGRVLLHELTLDEQRRQYEGSGDLPQAIQHCLVQLLATHGISDVPRVTGDIDEVQLFSLARLARVVSETDAPASAVRELGALTRIVSRVILRNTSPDRARTLFGDDLSVFDAPLALAGRQQVFAQYLREPDDAFVLAAMGQELTRANRHDEALKIYDRAVRLQPNQLSAHVGAMALYADAGYDGERWHDAEERAAVLAECAARGELVQTGTLASEALTLRAEAHRAGGRLSDYANLLGVEAPLIEHERSSVRLAAQRGQFATVAKAALDATTGDLIARLRALVSLGRYTEAAQVFEHAAPGLRQTPMARVYYAEARLARGDLYEGLYALYSARAASPLGRLETHVSRLLRLAAAFTAEEWQAAIARAPSLLARRLMQDGAGVQLLSVPKRTPLPFSEAWLDPLREAIGTDRAVTLDRLFVVQARPTLAEADRLVAVWQGVLSRFASEQGVPNPGNPDVAPALLYVATVAICRWLSLARNGASPLLQAYRTIAHEALAGARFVDVEIPELLAALQAIEAASGGDDYDQEALTEWLIALDRAFDTELEIGGHTAAYFSDLDHVLACHYGDEARASDALRDGPAAARRLVLFTGDTVALDVWRQSGDADAEAFAALLACDALAPTTGADATTTNDAFSALEAGDPRAAQSAAARILATTPQNFDAWRALLIACDYRQDDDWAQPAEPGLKVASTLMDVTQGTRDRTVSALRAFAMRVVEAHACTYDRPMELPSA